MPEPKVRFKRDDGSSYPSWKEYAITDLFTKISNKNKDGQNTNVITNSAEFGLIPQRDYFDKDIAVEGNTGNYTIIQTGDFVYNPRKSTYAPMGPFNCYRLADDGIVSPLYSCLRPKGVLDSEYLLWYFQTDKWYGYVNDHGAQNGARHDRVGMTDKILMGIPVKAPCEEEQQKIADFLSTVDEVISTSEAEVTNLEKQKKAVMKKIFSQEVRFRREDGSDSPEWEEARFGDTVTIERGGSPRPIENYITEDDGLNWVKIGDAPKYGNYITSTAQRIIPEGLRKTRQVFVGDLILSNSMSFGKPYIMGIDGCIHDGWLLIRNDQELYDLMYLCFLLGSDYMLKQYKSLAGGSAVNNLNKDLVAGTTVFIPCLEEQRLIADFLSSFDEAIAAAKKELELWKELKKGLLQQMFV